MNKAKVVTFYLLLLLLSSTNCYAKTELPELKKYEKSEMILIENKEEYENNIENEITVDGIKYKLKEVKEQENKTLITRGKTKKEEKIVTSGDKYNALSLFEEKKRIEDDGYTGILELQNDSLDLKIYDSYTEQYKVKLKKEYNNIPKNELNDIPKIIKENGITYFLVDPVWNVIQTQKIDGQEIPILYNGSMNYEGVKERRIIKNYLATVTYKGTLQKEEINSITYSLIYEENPIIEDTANYYIPVITATGTVILVFSGFLIYKRKNVFIYNYINDSWKLVKKLHFSKNENIMNITPTVPSITSKYKIVLNNKLYKELLHKNITIKYFDSQYIYEVKEKEFEIYV